ncbi:MAG: YfiR/HmsC family protein [Bacteroidales bacterium]
MYIIIRRLVSLLLTVLLLLVPIKTSAQLSDKNKAIWIVQNFAPNIEWNGEELFDKYTIAVYGVETEIYNELVALSKTSKINNKEFTVVRFRRVKDITPTNILFVEFESNDEIKSIFENISYNTLLITDQCNSKEYFMLNLLQQTSARKKFEINKKNASDAGISFSNNILMHGGSEVELRDLYTKTDKELQKEKRNLEYQRAELAKQTAELERLKKENEKERQENDKQKQINRQQKAEIELQQKEIEEQKANLAKVQENLAIQQEKLTLNSRILESQEERIKSKQDTLLIQTNKLKEQNEQISAKEKIIQKKDTVLVEKNTQIDILRLAIIGFIILTLAIIVLLFFIWRGSQIKKRINTELRQKNEAINKQKEEISSQHIQTELLNKELEKLSIVAARTENAVTIMDKDGNFEWVNVGFTRMYGYTLQLLTHELDENIRKVSANPDIDKILERCIRNKKSEIYECLNKTRNGQEIWVQTSLTPILDAEGNVSKLITIETDISKSKKAEREIRNQNEKILEQTHQLEATNKELEKLSLVASETDNAIAIMDAAGNYQWINDGFSRMFGYSFNQLITEYSGNLISKDTSKSIIELIKKSIEEKVPVSYEIRQKTRNNKEIWVQTTITPITDREKNIKSLVSISSDISKLKKAEQAIRQQSEELLTQKEELIIQKDRVELANLQIKSSINYAQTIQNAILPPTSILSKNFETFVIYKPKDIVSGDFYWYSSLPAIDNKKERYFYAAVDCTGHGVPGAFMSMIGSRLLNEIVNEKKIDQPSQILNIMNDSIKQILRQEQTDNNDGMDVCLCTFENIQNGTTKLTFAGAKRPLYYFKKNEQSLKYIKGTRKTIGGTKARRNTEEFSDHEILLEKGDLVYLSTDGIIDQPSPDRVRFGSLRFINLLQEIGNKPIPNQKEIIEKSILEYQEFEHQRDDVTFLGIKI